MDSKGKTNISLNNAYFEILSQNQRWLEKCLHYYCRFYLPTCILNTIDKYFWHHDPPETKKHATFSKKSRFCFLPTWIFNIISNSTQCQIFLHDPKILTLNIILSFYKKSAHTCDAFEMLKNEKYGQFSFQRWHNRQNRTFLASCGFVCFLAKNHHFE